jgi:DNA-binding NtrC family response regulator
MMKRKAHKPRVLVVDDEHSVLVTYQMILQQKGYDVVAAISSEEARKALDEAPLDLLLCDLSLEEKHTGFAVIEYARRVQPSLPALLLTGYATSDIAEKAQQNGIAALFKPIDIQELLGTIAAQLRSRHEQQTENNGSQSAVAK